LNAAFNTTLSRFSSLAWFGLAAFVAFLLTGCGGSSSATNPAPDQAAGKPLAAFEVFYTCDTRGHIYPCECTGGHAGGITRRAAFIKAQRSGPALLVDAGNNTAGVRDWEQIALRHLLEAKQQMGYHAVNLGHNDARLDAATLRQLGTKHPMLISANLVDEGTSTPVLPPYRVVELEGHRIGILGVMSEDMEGLGEGLRIESPAGAIALYLDELGGKCDTMVCLYYADELALEDLADQFYEFALIVGGKVGQASNKAITSNSSVIVFNSDKGKNMGHLTLQASPEQGWTAVTNTITTLYTDLPEDSSFQGILDAFEQEMGAGNFDTEKTKTDDAEGLQTIGGAK